MNLHPSTIDLHLQASTPSSQLWPNLLSLAPAQFLYQAPPGAQQLTRPDFLNVPQLGHIVLAEATPGVVNFGVLVILHRANHR